ncbi:MAG: DUF501 domain-containing protein [Actinobacteria bacterium]|nr:DUF501 domain-containing protein [Actinomycetota bacterium]
MVARCASGHPLVIRNHPVDERGAPFPTLYWLTCPETVKAVSRLESAGWIKSLDEAVEADPVLRVRFRRAHEQYAAERGTHLAEAGSWGGVGGAARGVKCLHAHYAYTIGGGRDPIGRWVAKRLAASEPVHYERPGRRLAAIDLGTNSIRLLVVRASKGEEEVVELARDMVITRLGQDVDRTGRLAPEALRRTVAVLGRYCRRARALGAERIHLAATSAVRDASNREALADAVRKLTGEPMEILSGDEEGRLTFQGATRGLNAPGPYLVVDIGGGSTEFVLGDRRPSSIHSVQIGSVRLTERFVRTDPPSFDELAAMERAVAEALSDVEDRVAVHDARTLVAVAGTATTVQAIALALPEYDPERLHRSSLPRGDAERVFRLLSDMTTAERRALPVMAAGREDVIPAGATILVSVMQRWGFSQAVVSETDILDGLASRMVGELDGR